MEKLFVGEKADPRFRTNHGSISSVGAIKVKGETRDRWFLRKVKRKNKYRSFKGIDYRPEAQCPSVELMGSWDKLDRT